MRCWPQIDPDGAGLTAGEIVRAIDHGGNQPIREAFARIMPAIGRRSAADRSTNRKQTRPFEGSSRRRTVQSTTARHAAVLGSGALPMFPSMPR